MSLSAGALAMTEFLTPEDAIAFGQALIRAGRTAFEQRQATDPAEAIVVTDITATTLWGS